MSVLRFAEHRAAFFFHSDNFQRNTAHFDGLSDRTLFGKKFVFDIRADDADLCRAFDFGIEIKRPSAIVLSSISCIFAVTPRMRVEGISMPS